MKKRTLSERIEEANNLLARLQQEAREEEKRKLMKRTFLLGRAMLDHLPDEEIRRFANRWITNKADRELFGLEPQS